MLASRCSDLAQALVDLFRVIVNETLNHSCITLVRKAMLICGLLGDKQHLQQACSLMSVNDTLHQGALRGY